MAFEMVSVSELKAIPMLAVAVVCLSLSWIVVSLRIYVRGFMIRSFGWDDWLMLITQVCLTSEEYAFDSSADSKIRYFFRLHAA